MRLGLARLSLFCLYSCFSTVPVCLSSRSGEALSGVIWALLGSLSSSTPVEARLGAEASLWALSHCPLRGHLLPKSGEG